MSLIPPPSESPFPELYWMAVAGVVFGFFMAFGIGANDVGNAFATSVSAKSLTLLQAVFVAGIFEFLGAFLLGASVTATIRNGILDMNAYEGKQEVLAFGNLVALVNASFWLVLATIYGLPVSTTHTVIAAMIGFSLAAEGWESIVWWEMSKIFISWIAAPFLTGIIGFVIFYVIKKGVLTSENPFGRAQASYSVVIFVAFVVNLFFVMEKGLKKYHLGVPLMLGVSFGASAVIAILFHFFGIKFLKARITRFQEEENNKAAAALEAGNSVTDSDPSDDDNVDDSTKKGKVCALLKKAADATYNRDLEKEAMTMDDDAADLWDKAEVYDEKSEALYSYLQVFTACALSFAHGSNDVANAIAPLCAILAIYDTGVLTKDSPVPKWVLLMGGLGIVAGLAILGYKVIISIGYRLTKLSPSRGFVIELSTSLSVVLASYLGIPVSTTQCTIGGVTGVGIVEGVGGVKWMFMLKVFLGWVGTFFITCITSAAIMGFCFYSPSSPAYYSENFDIIDDDVLNSTLA